KEQHAETVCPEQSPWLVGLDVDPQCIQTHRLGESHVAFQEVVVGSRVNALRVERLVEGRTQVHGFAVQKEPLERLVAVFAATDRSKAEVRLNRVDDLAAGIL